jgi:hypothetical protein
MAKTCLNSSMMGFGVSDGKTALSKTLELALGWTLAGGISATC